MGISYVRRIYLLGVLVLPIILPLLPDSVQVPVGNIAPISLQLEGVTILEQEAAGESATPLLVGRAAMILYLLILGLGLMKLIHQLSRITLAAISSQRMDVEGNQLLANRPSMPAPFLDIFSSIRNP